MKNKTLAIMSALFLFYAYLSSSICVAGSIAMTSCTVGTSIDNFNHPDVSIRYAEFLFNRDGSKQKCRESINFGGAYAISLTNPIVMKGGNVTSTGEVVFGIGTSVTDGSTEDEATKKATKVVFSVTSATSFANEFLKEGDLASLMDGETEETKCAFYIKTKGAHLKNIKLEGNNVQANGICIDASDVILENVIVDGFDGDGIRVSSNATNVTFKGIVVVGGSVKTGIRVLGGYSTMQTRIKFPFDEEAKAVANKTVLTEGLDLLGAQENMIVLPGTAQIKPDSLCTTYDETSSTYTVQGFITCENCTEAQQIKKLYLFAIPSLSSSDQQSVGEKVLAAPIQVVEGGTAGYIGYFNIPYIPQDPDNPGRLFVLPEVSPGLFASTSKTIELNFKTTCTGANADMDETGPGGVGKSSNLGGTLQECSKLGVLGIDPSLMNFDQDSDGDGIYDKIEMMSFIDANPTSGKHEITINTVNAKQKAQCDCSNTYLCWYKPDSDGDGISDLNDGSKVVHTGGTNWTIKLLNSDGDNKPDVYDVDSDNDNIPDGSEDRSRVFNYSDGLKSGKAKYLYYGSESDVQMNGESVWCYDPSGTATDGTYKPDVGISYGLYYADANGSLLKETNGKLKAYNVGVGAFPDGAAQVISLECRNIRLKDATNFNGKWDSFTGETDFQHADTDRDGICDGSGTCQTYTFTQSDMEEIMTSADLSAKNDACPLTKSVLGQKFCRLTCVDSEIKDGISEQFASIDDNTGHVKSIDKDALYKALKENPQNWRQYCSDIDTDGLPDCLEWMTDSSLCQELDQQRNSGGRFYDPYTKDTDSDGLVDGPAQGAGASVALSDKCPFDTETDDDASEDINKLSCKNSAYDVYKYQPLLAYFLDRDGDSLMDAAEDKDLSGGKPSIVMKLDGVGKTESDPLRKDSDDDKLADEIEVINLHTNPSDPDTDEDKLSDFEEVNRDLDPTTVKVTLGTVVGKNGICFADEKQLGDTDPLSSDTDGDTILDGQEIKNKTNPNNIDSDSDGLNDDKEDKNKNGIWPKYEGMNIVGGGNIEDSDYSDTNPCDANTDHQGLDDKQEMDGGTCPGNPDPACKYKPESFIYGFDTDSDGIPDGLEAKFGTDKNNPDSDSDGLIDGCDSTGKGELCWHVKTKNWEASVKLTEGIETDPAPCAIDPTEADQYVISNSSGHEIQYFANLVGNRAVGTNNFCGVQVAKACGADSDGDGLPDAIEYQVGTNPGQIDSDQDGIIDSIELKWLMAFAVAPAKDQIYAMKPTRGVVEYSVGTSTDPLNADTDDDKLVDGSIAANNFEDRNCNGKADINEAGQITETDPRNGDSNGNGVLDAGDLNHDGVVGDVNRAVSATRSGCASIGGAGGETWGMTIMFAVLLAMTRVLVVVMRKTKRMKMRR